MKRAILLVSFLAGCMGTYVPPPDYAYRPPPPPPAAVPVPEPQVLPVDWDPGPITSDRRCTREDSPRLCTSLITMLEIGDVLRAAETLPCRKAAASLNRYADENRGRLEDLQDLARYESQRQLDAFQQRHEYEVQAVMGLALELRNRCDDNRRVGEALARVGFTGIVVGAL